MTDITCEIAAIRTTVESVGTLVDRGEFDALSRLYADELTLDYSSLNGQPAAKITPSALMAQWASVLPGFDRTRHALSDVDVSLDGITAAAHACVVASHWVGADFWQVAGHYDYALAKKENGWVITSMTFTLESEKGSRDVFGPAIEAAATKNLPGHKMVIGDRNKETVRKFFRLLEEENIDDLVELFAEGGVQRNPYTAGVFPEGAEGKEALLEYWGRLPGTFDDMKFPIDDLLATEDPNMIFARYRGEITLKDGAGVYRNDYYSTFRFNREGKIVEYIEIFDPVVAARGFGLLDQIH